MSREEVATSREPSRDRSASRMPCDLTISIDHVVLTGVSPTDWRAIESGIRSELEDALHNGELDPANLQDVQLEGIDAGSLTYSPATPPRDIGTHLGRAIVEDLR